MKIWFVVKGGKTTREIAEQRRIDELGGVKSGNLENKRNPIGQARVVQPCDAERRIESCAIVTRQVNGQIERNCLEPMAWIQVFRFSTGVVRHSQLLGRACDD